MSDNAAGGLELFRYGTFIIRPPVDVRTTVNALRARYDPTSHAVSEAHVTLTQPFVVEPEDETWRAIDAVCAAHEPFEIEFGPLHTFLPYPCVYLDIQPADIVLRLRADLHALGMFNLTLPYTEGFVPHMTISDHYVGEERTREIFAELRDNAPEGTFLCDRITWIVPDDRFTFRVAREVRLGR
jgi:2'-5' RNA ligase